MCYISVTGHSDTDSSWGTSASVSVFYNLRPPGSLPSLPRRARVLPFHVLVSACSCAFVSDGQPSIGNAGSCIYIQRACCFTNLARVCKPGWMCEKSSALLGRREVWGWSAVFGADSHSVHRSMSRWCNKPGPGQTTSCTFGYADPGHGIWQYSWEETDCLAYPLQGSWVVRGKAGQAASSKQQSRV